MNLSMLLKDGVRYAPFYKPSGNSNHLPMTLAAMNALGASQDQLMKFRADYSPRLHEVEQGEQVDRWLDGLGRPDTYGSLVELFSTALSDRGVQTVVDEVLMVTLSGLSADAFHPLIRLGYAMEFNCIDEVAAALAYMVVVHCEMPHSSEPVNLRKVIKQQSKAGALTLEANGFSQKMAELVKRSSYPLGRAQDLATIAGLALHLYRSTRNFFALHLVTSTQALRCVISAETVTEKSVSEKVRELAISSMTSAVLGSHLVLGSPGVIVDPLAAPDRLDPEHAYKYLWSCWSQYQAYGDPVYLEEIRLFRDSGLVPRWAGAVLLDDAN